MYFFGLTSLQLYRFRDSTGVAFFVLQWRVISAVDMCNVSSWVCGTSSASFGHRSWNMLSNMLQLPSQVLINVTLLAYNNLRVPLSVGGKCTRTKISLNYCFKPLSASCCERGVVNVHYNNGCKILTRLSLLLRKLV